MRIRSILGVVVLLSSQPAFGQECQQPVSGPAAVGDVVVTAVWAASSPEVVILRNVGESPVALAGWKICNEETGEQYAEIGGAVLAPGAEFPVLGDGRDVWLDDWPDRATLLSADGRVAARFDPAPPPEGPVFKLDEIEVEVEREANTYLERKGFYDRRDMALAGEFFPPEYLAVWKPGRLSQLLHHSGEVRMFRFCQRGSSRCVWFPAKRGCGASTVYVDGFKRRMSISGGGIDEVLMHEVDAVEVYGGAASIPAQFGGTDAQCGVVAIWTKR